MEEPLLRYGRFNAKLSGTLPAGAVISAATLHPNFLALGTSVGSVHVFELGAPAIEWRRLAAHTCHINDLCTDAGGEFLGTAAEDGSVVVSAVLSEERTVHSHHRAVKAVRLTPDFARNRDRPLITGGVTGRLYLLRKNWITGMSERMMHEGEGPIRAIAVMDSLVAWANDAGVKVLDYEREDPICFLEAPPDTAPPAVCPPRLVWESSTTLLMAWGHHVRIVKLAPRDAAAAAAGPSSGAPTAAAAPVSAPPPQPSPAQPAVAAATPLGASGSGTASAPAPASAPGKRQPHVTRPCLEDGAAIAGIAPYGDDLALLCYCVAEESDEVTVELRIISRVDGYHPLHREVLPLTGVGPSTMPSDLHLLVRPDEVVGHERLPLLFVVAPQDVVVASPRSPADQIEWRARHGRPAEALAIALAHKDAVPPPRVRELCDAYVKWLIDTGHPRAAAAAVALLYPAATGTVAPSSLADGDRWLAYAFALPGGDASTEPVAPGSPLPALPPSAEALRARRDAFSDAALAGVVLRLHGGKGALGLAKPSRPADGSSSGAAGGAVAPGGTDDGRMDGASAAAIRVITRLADAGGGASRLAMPQLSPASYHAVLAHLLATAPVGRYLEAVWVTLQRRAPSKVAPRGDDGATVHAGAAPGKPLVDVALVADDVAALHGRLKDEAHRAARAGDGGGSNWDAVVAAAELLVELFGLAGRWEEAVRLYLDQHAALSSAGGATAWLGRSSARLFHLLHRHDLYHLVADKVALLLQVDQEAAIAAMAERLDAFPVDGVALQLQTAPAQLLRFLHHLIVHKTDAYNDKANAPMHDVQLSLYFAIDTAGLHAFLERSTNYSLETARLKCATATPAPLYRELVYVLTRMGNPKAALSLLLDKLNDVKGAVRLASTYDDDELWTDLVKRTLAARDGATIGALLDHIINSPLNPYRIVDLLPRGIAIPHLQQRLLATLRDRRVHMHMVSTCRDLFRDDVMALIHRFHHRRTRGMPMSSRAACALCQAPLGQHVAASAAAGVGTGAGGESGAGEAAAGEGASSAAAGPAVAATLFFCGHAFHAACLADYRAKLAAAEAAAAAAAASAAGGRDRSRSRSSSAAWWSGEGGRGRAGSVAADGGAGGGGGAFGAAGVGARPLSSPPGGGRRRRLGSSSRLHRDSSVSGLLELDFGGPGGSSGGGGGGGRSGLETPTAGGRDALDGEDGGGGGGSMERRCPLCFSAAARSPTAAVAGVGLDGAAGGGEASVGMDLGAR